MRTIKFRGFHADEHGKTVIKLDGKEIRGFWCYGDLHTDGPYIAEHLVLPETVGQYTGIKDALGKEIFDGDIIRSLWSSASLIYFDDCFAGFRAKEKKLSYAIFSNRKIDRNILGNIFEKPELLEVEV